MKDRLRELGNEDLAKGWLKQTLELLVFFNKNAAELETLLEDAWAFFMDDFVLAVSKILTLLSKYAFKETLILVNNILRSVVLLFLKLPLKGKLYECFKVILDPKRNFNRFLNQNPEICNHVIIL